MVDLNIFNQLLFAFSRFALSLLEQTLGSTQLIVNTSKLFIINQAKFKKGCKLFTLEKNKL